MNNKAFYNLTYGVFLLAAKAEEKAKDKQKNKPDAVPEETEQ